MEREELDQIPWSQLAIDADDGVDRRWYIVGIAVGLVVVAVLAFRLLSGGSGQPDPVLSQSVEAGDPVSARVDEPAASPGSDSATAGGGGSGSPVRDSSGDRTITEADLTVDEPASDDEQTVVAEWFITDLFTVDGSPETAAALRARISPDLVDDPLAHDAPDAVEAFVEWARAFGVEDTGTGWMVSVAFRTIRRTETGYVREPVRAVVVPMSPIAGRWVVTAWPTAIDPP